MVDQLSTDTASLKSAEEARTERLDSAIREVESVMEDLKYSSRRRDDETRRISEEVRSMKDAIPRALQGAREGNENRLKDLGTEVRSLKVLLGNRLGGGSGASSPVPGRAVGASTLPGTSRPADELSSASPTPTSNGTAPASIGQESQTPTNGVSQQPSALPSAATAPRSSPLSSGKAPAIPAWQMAAKADSTPKPNPSTTPAASTPSEVKEQQNGSS